MDGFKTGQERAPMVLVFMRDSDRAGRSDGSPHFCSSVG